MVDPSRHRRQVRRVVVAIGSPGKNVGAIGAGGVVALPGHDHSAVAAADDHRLMPGSVARCGHDEHTGEDLRFAVENLIGEPGSLDKFGQGVARVFLGGLQLDSLGEDRTVREAGISPAMVEMKMAVDHQGDAFERGTRRGQRGGERLAPGSVVGIDLRMAPHTGVKKQQTIWVVDEVAKTWLDSRTSASSLIGRPDEVTKIHAPHTDICHDTDSADPTERWEGPDAPNVLPLEDEKIACTRHRRFVYCLPERFFDGSEAIGDLLFGQVLECRQGPCSEAFVVLPHGCR